MRRKKIQEAVPAEDAIKTFVKNLRSRDEDVKNAKTHISGPGEWNMCDWRQLAEVLPSLETYQEKDEESIVVADAWLEKELMIALVQPATLRHSTDFSAAVC